MLKVGGRGPGAVVAVEDVVLWWWGKHTQYSSAYD